MTYVLVVMAFMNTAYRQDWGTPYIPEHVFGDIASCEAVGKAMQEMEKRTQYRCVPVWVRK